MSKCQRCGGLLLELKPYCSGCTVVAKPIRKARHGNGSGPKPPHTNCVTCGSSIEQKVGVAGRIKKFCSKECRNRSYGKGTWDNTHCAFCSAEIVGRARRYCGDTCRDAAYKARDRAKSFQAVCEWCGKQGIANGTRCCSARECRLARQKATQYGISLTDLKLLGDACEICGETENLAIDHCHVSGKVRGRLCFNCNGGLGNFKDNVNSLERAIDYLKSR